MVSEKDDGGVSPSYPLIPIRSDKKSDYNRIEKYNRIDQKKKPLRSPVTFYMSEDIANTWRRYCSLVGLRVSYLTEEALLRYMRDNPAPQVTLNVTQDLAAYSPTVQDRLRNKILREKISTVLATIRRIKAAGKGDYNVFKKQLQKLVLQATNLKRPEEGLLELLREAEELI